MRKAYDTKNVSLNSVYDTILAIVHFGSVLTLLKYNSQACIISVFLWGAISW